MNTHNAIPFLVLLGVLHVPCLAQQLPSASECKQAVFNALKPLPEFTYKCPDGLNDGDEKILEWPERKAALEPIQSELELFTAATWWQADVSDLTACELHGSAGNLTGEELSKLKDGDYLFRLFGDHQYRLVLIADPCYQTDFGGSNGFLLYRNAGKVFVTQVLNGYYSRIDNSVGIDSANLNGERIIEISTANNMPPEITNYYFAIDAKTHRAIPKKIFKVSGRLTNNMSSAILFDEDERNHTPQNTVVRRHRLAPTFSVYIDDYRGKIDDNGRKLRRVIYRWNGRFYSPTR